MRVRCTTVIGMPVTDDQLEEDVGRIGGVVIHPDTGVIEGFFVDVQGFFSSRRYFLSALDIVHFGARVRIRHVEVLSFPEDIIRLQKLLDEGRTVLGRPVVTESNVRLGRRMDAQFETKTFRVEWFFPKKWFRWKTPVRATDVVRVTKDAIIVKDPVVVEPIPVVEKVVSQLEPLITPAS